MRFSSFMGCQLCLQIYSAPIISDIKNLPKHSGVTALSGCPIWLEFANPSFTKLQKIIKTHVFFINLHRVK
jgi:hypothetical protein